MNKYVRWFRWAVVLGILQDWFLALPGIVIPNAVLGLAGAEPARQPVWPAFACLILVLLTGFYLLAVLDPFRYRPFAVLTVLARAAGVVFFFVLYRGQFPALFGSIDLTLTLLQGTALVLALSHPRPAAAGA